MKNEMTNGIFKKCYKFAYFIFMKITTLNRAILFPCSYVRTIKILSSSDSKPKQFSKYLFVDFTRLFRRPKLREKQLLPDSGFLRSRNFGFIAEDLLHNKLY